MDKKIKTRLVQNLKSHKLTLDDLCGVFSVEPEEMQVMIQELQDSNIAVDVRTGHRTRKLVYHINMLPDTGNVYFIGGKDNKERNMEFAAISDIHFGSVFHLPLTFRDTMKALVDRGVKRVYVAGDVVDGNNIYRGHIENLVTHSIEGQTDIAAKALSDFPELEFWGIAGNHDYSFTKKDGSKPLAILEQKTDNFKNLGDLRADIITRGIRIRLLHGGSGRAYARSYPSQTYLRDLFGGTEKAGQKDMPHIILLGHYHTLYQGLDHGIHIIQAGSFQDGDNEYCLRRGLTGPNGGFMVDFSFKNGLITEFGSRYIQPKIVSRERGKAFSKTTVNY